MGFLKMISIIFDFFFKDQKNSKVAENTAILNESHLKKLITNVPKFHLGIGWRDDVSPGNWVKEWCFIWGCKGCLLFCYMFLFLSSIIAGIGLVENSSVLLVASMLVSPLMVTIVLFPFVVAPLGCLIDGDHLLIFDPPPPTHTHAHTYSNPPLIYYGL